MKTKKFYIVKQLQRKRLCFKIDGFMYCNKHSYYKCPINKKCDYAPF